MSRKRIQYKSRTKRNGAKKQSAQNKSSHRVTMTASLKSGEGGIRDGPFSQLGCT